MAFASHHKVKRARQLWYFRGCFMVSGALLPLLSTTCQPRAGRRAISASLDSTAAYTSSGRKDTSVALIIPFLRVPPSSLPTPIQRALVSGGVAGSPLPVPLTMTRGPALSRESGELCTHYFSLVRTSVVPRSPFSWVTFNLKCGRAGLLPIKAPQFSTSPSSS